MIDIAFNVLFRNLSLKCESLSIKSGASAKCSYNKNHLRASQVRQEVGLPEDYDSWTLKTNLLGAAKEMSCLMT